MGSTRQGSAQPYAQAVWPHVFALLLLCALLLPRRSFSADGDAGKWTVVQGHVAVTQAGAGGARIARTGDSVAVGDLLETGKDARAQAFLADDTVVNLSSGTSARILQYSFDPASGRRTAVVKVLGGKARFIVSARKNSRFNVESAQAAVAAVATAADFVTIVTPEATTVATLDGSVKVKNVSNLIVAECDLWPNQTTVVRIGAAPSHPAPIVPRQRKDYRKDARDF